MKNRITLFTPLIGQTYPGLVSSMEMQLPELFAAEVDEYRIVGRNDDAIVREILSSYSLPVFAIDPQTLRLEANESEATTYSVEYSGNTDRLAYAPEGEYPLTLGFEAYEDGNRLYLLYQNLGMTMEQRDNRAETDTQRLMKWAQGYTKLSERFNTELERRLREHLGKLRTAIAERGREASTSRFR